MSFKKRLESKAFKCLGFFYHFFNVCVFTFLNEIFFNKSFFCLLFSVMSFHFVTHIDLSFIFLRVRECVCVCLRACVRLPFEMNGHKRKSSVNISKGNTRHDGIIEKNIYIRFFSFFKSHLLVTWYSVYLLCRNSIDFCCCIVRWLVIVLTTNSIKKLLILVA